MPIRPRLQHRPCVSRPLRTPIKQRHEGVVLVVRWRAPPCRGSLALGLNGDGSPYVQGPRFVGLFSFVEDADRAQPTTLRSPRYPVAGQRCLQPNMSSPIKILPEVWLRRNREYPGECTGVRCVEAVPAVSRLGGASHEGMERRLSDPRSSPSDTRGALVLLVDVTAAGTAPRERVPVLSLKASVGEPCLLHKHPRRGPASRLRNPVYAIITLAASRCR